MKKLSEGQKMWVSVMVIFIIYATIFFIFDDYDRKHFYPLDEINEWHLLLFSAVVMGGLGLLLHHYARSMDRRISREQAEKESRMRRELTQNIAHELKTPVASILGYTETIINTPDMDDDTRKLFISRTHAQAQRLTTLLQDISTLNRMNDAAHLLTRERVDVAPLVADIARETAPKMEKNNMTMRNNLPQDIILRANYSLVYSIFRNLIDNAINYAGTGSTVTVSATEEADRWNFTVEDDGTGIPEEHLPRIFERFYRIDKSRSRSLGGTGLGLAIVKNAVVLHGGTITVCNKSTNGLAFHFSLRKQ